MPDDAPSQPGLTELAACQTRGDFGRLLTRLRNSAGLSIRRAQLATKIPTATLGDYFKGTHLPPPRDRTLERILVACGVTDAPLLAAWEAALERVRLSPGRPPANAPAPYRGLAFFRTEDAGWFFGRERLTTLLTERAASQRARGVPLVVVGPSGAGKSSLLRAGLMPALGPGTETILLTPGAHPLNALASASAARPAGTLAGDPRLALVVDQFEEVFAPGVGEEERQAFIAALCEAAAPSGGGATLVVLGLRADFYARALADPRLAGFLQDSQIVVGPMTEDELRRAIVEPARKARVDLEPGLVDLLLRDIRPVTARSGGARSGCAAAAVARPAVHLAGAQGRPADHRRLPQQRRHRGRGGPIGGRGTGRAERRPAGRRAAPVSPAGLGLRRHGRYPPPGTARRTRGALDRPEHPGLRRQHPRGAGPVRGAAADHQRRRDGGDHARGAADGLAATAALDRREPGQSDHSAADHRVGPLLAGRRTRRR